MDKTPSPSGPKAAPVRRLSRSDVAKQLGVSVGTVRNLEKAGHLQPAKENGVNLFDPKQIADLRAARERENPGTSLRREPEGEIAGRCFDLFAAGKSVRDVVRELRLPPERVRALRREYEAGDAEPRRPEPNEDDSAIAEEDRRARAEQEEVFATWERDMARAYRGAASGDRRRGELATARARLSRSPR